MGGRLLNGIEDCNFTVTVVTYLESEVHTFTPWKWTSKSYLSEETKIVNVNKKVQEQ